MNNLSTTSAKYINLDIIRMFIEYSLKEVLVKSVFTFTPFEIFLFEGRSVLPHAQPVTGSEKVEFRVLWELLEK